MGGDKFISKYKIKNYATLDVIGNGEETLKNTEYMISKGFKPIYTFHKGEEMKYLEECYKPHPLVGVMKENNQ